VISLLETLLADNRQAWDMNSDGSYVQRKPGRGPVISTHERLLEDPWGQQPIPATSGLGQSAAPTSSS